MQPAGCDASSASWSHSRKVQMVHICRQDRSVSQKQEILVRKLHILPTVNAAQTTVMEPEHAISTRRACFICRFYLVDLEPSGDTSCVVVMLARQRYHTFSVSETRQADRTAASKPKRKKTSVM